MIKINGGFFTDTLQKMRITISILTFLILSSCNKQSKIIEVNSNKVVGIWKLDLKNDSLSFITAKLNLLENNTFKYSGKYQSKISLFSLGKWKIVSDTLYLKTENINKCYYLWNGISTQCENFDNSKTENGIVVKQHFVEPTTIKNCLPKSRKVYYSKFTDEKFLVKNDLLIYVPKKYDCSKYIPGIKIIIEK
ncbi:hypothetical protein [Chryseobacterium piscicola]|uniref:Uncharacterized protein n=1 Tax=Chryseobacterium piscicola TaxID=551459 RepID=A0A2S7KE35_9FLAO|nr:hypothetical protein [Chryseobacterium piscicola]PQA92730.1 hypothetical protein B0A70_10110 [Chryseobacterium piscicola]